MAEQNDSFKFDLDGREALKHLTEIREKILQIGEADNLKGLVTGLTSLAGPIAVAAAAYLAFKTAMDMTLEAESLEKINHQFELLTEQVGISTESLKEGIEKSIGPGNLLSDSLKSANRALIEIGPNAQKLPELFTLARKTASAFGGDVNENLEGMARAIATGSTRLLRQQGIVVDAQKAYEKYAASINSTVKVLSEEGKQQAILNEILKQGDTKFKNISPAMNTLGESLKELRVSAKEFMEYLSIAVEKTGVVKTLVDGWKTILHGAAGVLKDNFGSAADQSSAKVQGLSDRLNSLKANLQKQESGEMGWWDKLTTPDTDFLKNKITEVKAELADAMKTSATLNPPKVEEEKASAPKINGEDAKKKLLEEAKFQGELLKITEQRLKSEQDIETNNQRLREQLEQEIFITAQQYDAKILQAKLEGEKGGALSSSQAAQLAVQIEEEKTNKIIALQRDIENAQLKSYDNQLKVAKSYSEGFMAASAQAGAQANRDLTNFGKVGTMAFGAVNTGAANFFRGLGKGTESAADLMKGFMFNALGDIADAQGQLLLAAGLGTMNPVQIAEGGALLALGGLLHSQAGGSSSSVGGGAGGGSGGGVGSTPSANSLTEKPTLAADNKKNVTVQVMGHYFETEQTQTRLLEMIRSATDGTDFKYQQIGAG